jgi:rare lipoprotein A
MLLRGCLKRNGKSGLMKLSAKIVSTFVVLSVSVLPFVGSASAQTGRASYYSLTSRTANGERCNPGAMTAAHRSLPFGTKVKVENLRNGKSVVVRINDRGPFVGGRIIDLTKGAAHRIGMVKSGTASVRLTVLARN